MELIDIIRTSLIIFTLISSMVLATSYLVYKLRDRKRVKPYRKEGELAPSVVLVKTNQNKVTIKPELKERNPRFHILNENPPVKSIKTADSLPVHTLRQNPVISYYSFNKNENLHKFRSSRMADEGA